MHDGRLADNRWNPFCYKVFFYNENFLNGGCMACTGKTSKQNVTLAPSGDAGKITGKECT